jgi:hypothetical protein
MELDLVYTWVDGAEPRHLISRLWYFIQLAFYLKIDG